MNLFAISGNCWQSRIAFSAIITKLKNAYEVNPHVVTIHYGNKTKDAEGFVYNANDIITCIGSKDIFEFNPTVYKIIGTGDDHEALAFYLESVQTNFFLKDNKKFVVFYGFLDNVNIDSGRAINLKNQKIGKLIEKHGKSFEFKTEAETVPLAVDLVTKFAEDNQKTIAADVAKILVAKNGLNIDFLYNFIQKLSTYQKSKEIKLEDVENCAVSNFQMQDSVWVFLEYINSSNLESCLMHLEKLFDTFNNNFYGNIHKMLCLLENHYLFILALKDLNNKNLDAKLIYEKLAEQFKKNRNNKLEPQFSMPYIYKNYDSPLVRKSLSLRKSNIYRYTQGILTTIINCRKNSSNESILKLNLNMLVYFLCDKIELKMLPKVSLTEI